MGIYRILARWKRGRKKAWLRQLIPAARKAKPSHVILADQLTCHQGLEYARGGAIRRNHSQPLLSELKGSPWRQRRSLLLTSAFIPAYPGGEPHFNGLFRIDLLECRSCRTASCSCGFCGF